MVIYVLQRRIAVTKTRSCLYSKGHAGCIKGGDAVAYSLHTTDGTHRSKEGHYGLLIIPHMWGRLF